MRRFGRQSSWRGRRQWCHRSRAGAVPRGTEVQENPAISVSVEESPPRAVRRFISKQSITAAVNEDGFPIACGEVRDLSESGACVVTDLVLKRGWRIELKVSLNRLGVFETQGHVVWSGEGPYGQDAQHAKGGVLGVLHGVQFTGLPDSVRSRLKGLLGTNAFDLAPSTFGGAADRTPFQEMLEALQPELDRLGIKMD